MQSERPVILLVGSDPDVLALRSAVLASAGMWSLRVRDADQAIAVLGTVPCDLIAICYMLDEDNQQQLLDFLFTARCKIKVLWIHPGDDCSGTGFVMKIDDALEERPPATSRMGSIQLAAALS